MTMKFVSDPPISVKIRKMKERVRWQDPFIVDRGIDQTRMVLDDGGSDSSEFSFLVVGDSGSGSHGGHNPQRQIAKQMLLHRDSSRFVLHTGDVIYLVGSSEYYKKNFIEPYREFILGGEHPDRIAYNQMTFNLPFLPVPGNHDYYDLPLIFGLIAQTTKPFQRLLRSVLDFDVGWHGSFQGNAYAQAFIDYLKTFNSQAELAQHLDRHYGALTETGYCLRYQPGQFTRLPNRYYTFRYGGIDFFALDSNTFNDPIPVPVGQEGAAYRRLLAEQQEELEQQQQEIMATAATLNPNQPDEAEHLDDLRTKLQQIEETLLDIDKQLQPNQTTVIDYEQLDWLRERLIASWNNKEVRGRVIYFHHPPYVTEATKWNQAQTLAVRQRLRAVFDAVANAVGDLTQGRGVVDLVLNGHAHCLEYLQTGNTGHADSHINWIVCGGSGYSLRRQRSEGSELRETFTEDGGITRTVASCKLFVGRNGQGGQKRRPYSFLRIDVLDGCPPKFRVRPFIAERSQRKWIHSEIQPFVIST
ncbi:metallophosphoesterase [Crinalium epipsammum PCC 9333]|uniref:Metallophosphoesterase n=2 Tax=Crinalium TaxID=241421 RepID=K9W035_9CYAN|nr:metallophosphoesterase [Crinalium epipsammum PCC 9333]